MLEGTPQPFVVVAVEVRQEPGFALEQLGALPKAVHQEGGPLDTLPLVHPARKHGAHHPDVYRTAALAIWL